MSKQSSAAVAEELVLSEVSAETETQDANRSVRKLRRKVEALREAMAKKILREVKDCRESCENAMNLVGDLNAIIKQNSG